MCKFQIYHTVCVDTGLPVVRYQVVASSALLEFTWILCYYYFNIDYQYIYIYIHMEDWEIVENKYYYTFYISTFFLNGEFH